MTRITLAQAGMIALSLLALLGALLTPDDNESGCLAFLALCIGLTTFLFWTYP